MFCLCSLLGVLWFQDLHLGLAFKYWEFIFFGIWCEKMFWFYSFTCSCPIFPEPLIEETVLSIVYSCLLCQRLIVHRCVGLCLGFVSCSIDLSVFSASPILFGLLWWLRGKDSTCQWRRCGFDPWVEKTPWSRKWQPTPVLLPGKSLGQRSLKGYSLWSHKKRQTQLSN